MRGPAIRLRYTAGPIRHDDEFILIVGYRTVDDRDWHLRRLHHLAGQPTPWEFTPTIGDLYDADLYADARSVAKAVVNLDDEAGSLTRDPDWVLELLRSPADGARRWYSVDKDGVWADVRTIAEGAAE